MTSRKSRVPFVSYEESAKLARNAGITSRREYRAWKRPKGLPSHPEDAYQGQGWLSWGAFLGTWHLANRGNKKIFVSYEEAVRLVRTAGITSFGAFRHWKRPVGVPSGPHRVFSKTGEWKDWYTFLGTSSPTAKMLSYEESRRLVRMEGIRTTPAFRAWNRPPEVPSNPDTFYRAEWISFMHFFGTKRNTSVRGKRSYRPYSEAARIALQEGFGTARAYRAWKKRPKDIPSNPNMVYREWRGWPAYLGIPVDARQGPVSPS